MAGDNYGRRKLLFIRSDAVSYTEVVTEAAIAVLMVIIINGYVALRSLSIDWHYIVALDIIACIAWGFIDGFVGVMGNAIERGNSTAMLNEAGRRPSTSIGAIAHALEDTFIGELPDKTRNAVARLIAKSAPRMPRAKAPFTAKDDYKFLFTIMGAYILAGIVMSLPYVVLPDKFHAWVVSNVIGIAWLFAFGWEIGTSLRSRRLPIALVTAGTGIVFLLLTYALWA